MPTAVTVPILLAETAFPGLSDVCKDLITLKDEWHERWISMIPSRFLSSRLPCHTRTVLPSSALPLFFFLVSEMNTNAARHVLLTCSQKHKALHPEDLLQSEVLELQLHLWAFTL